MNIAFVGEPEDDRHEEVILWVAIVDGRRVQCRFTLNAIRSVMPRASDGRDLRVRVASHPDVFASLVASKLNGVPGDLPAELIITEADIPEGT